MKGVIMEIKCKDKVWKSGGMYFLTDEEGAICHRERDNTSDIDPIWETDRGDVELIIGGQFLSSYGLSEELVTNTPTIFPKLVPVMDYSAFEILSNYCNKLRERYKKEVEENNQLKKKLYNIAKAIEEKVNE